MENYPYSYPDSHDSSPRSRDNESWDDQQQQQQPSSNYKVKFMCSYGGKIHPRPHDNQLAYVGGETKILSVDRNIKFSTIVSKLSSLSDYEVCFKYQLPGEDLDALISVTNEEDLEHMMLEYDRLYRVAGSRPARLRLFLFPIISSNQSSFSADDHNSNSNSKPSQQWFADALNSVPSIQSSLDSSPPASSTNTDFLFGFEKQQQQGNSPTVAKLMDPKPELVIQEPKIMIGSDVGRDDRNIGAGVGGESMYEIQRQIQELQRLQIANQHEQQPQQQQAVMYQRKHHQQGGFHGDYYMPEKQLPLPTGVPVSVPVSVPQTGYWQQEQRQTTVTGGYSDQLASAGADRQLQLQQQQQQQQQQQAMYMMPSPGMYQTSAAAAATNVRPVTGHVGHGYYGGGMQGMQRVVPDVYREQQVYSMGPPPTQHQIQQPQAQAQMTKMMVGDTGGGYTTAQVAYDSTGRQVYYTTTTTGAPSQVPTSSYQTAVTTMSVVDPRQSGLNQDSKVVKPPQGSL